MKRCPTCQATYDDEKSYCIVEGSQLVTVAPAEPAPTMFAPSNTIASPPAEREMPAPAPPAGWSGGATSQPTSYVPFSQTTEAQAERPNILLKIVGGLLLLALGLGAGYAIASFTSKKGTNEPGAPTASANTNTSAQEDSKVLSELKELEDQMTGASVRGDKATMERMLADDYAATGADGKFYNRTQTLDSTVPTPSVTGWSVEGARLLSRSETSATLSAVVTFRSKTSGERQQITDTFMKRNGRWQLVASQSTLLK